MPCIDYRSLNAHNFKLTYPLPLDPRTRTVPPGILPGWSVQLEPFPPVGRVCTKFPPSEHHGPYAISVHTRLPTPALPVDGRAIGGSSFRLLVPGKRESVRLSSTSSRQCGGIRTLRMPGTLQLQSTTMETGCGYPPEICKSACPARSWVPAILVHSRSRVKSTRSHNSSNYPPGIEFTSSSTFSCSNHALLSLQISTSRTSLLLQKF